jgi:hypothetical protein
MNLLYKWVPYPNYPIKGIDLHVPLFKITQTTAISWQTIFMIIGGTVLFFIALQLLWRIFRIFLRNNKKVLFARIRYNRLLLTIGGFSGVGILILMFILRHVPTAFQGFVFIANLSRQNTPMNFTTAVGTFLVTIHAGYKNNSAASQKAQLANIPPQIIKKVFKDKMRQSTKYAFILGLGAFFITNNIPSAFELSVTTFEIMYMIYPYTFGRFLTMGDRPVKNITPPPTNEPATA